MRNLYKSRYFVEQQNNTRVINSNQMVAARMEELARQARKSQGGFVEGITPQPMEEVLSPMEILEEARKKADEIVANARKDAQKLVEDARAGASQVTEDARVQGERQGYLEGRALADEELAREEQELSERGQELEREYQEKNQKLEQEYENLRRNLEPEILGAVTDVFEKVFYLQLSDSKPVLLHLVENAILNIDNTREFRIRASRKNFSYLEEHLSEIQVQVGKGVKLELDADSTLDENSSVIETDSGFFDCSIDVELDNLLRTLRLLSV